MPIRVERILFKIGEGAIAVTLPKAWINYYDLKAGDRVEVIANQDLTIRILNRQDECEDTAASPGD